MGFGEKHQPQYYAPPAPQQAHYGHHPGHHQQYQPQAQPQMVYVQRPPERKDDGCGIASVRGVQQHSAVAHAWYAELRRDGFF
ncbi:hypothetical protein FRC06_006419 [Ceratobasidium sp. 370]|nr:hypothetical protein FRC06_006419 [Ceratobasidium sp. 370]